MGGGTVREKCRVCSHVRTYHVKGVCSHCLCGKFVSEFEPLSESELREKVKIELDENHRFDRCGSLACNHVRYFHHRRGCSRCECKKFKLKVFG